MTQIIAVAPAHYQGLAAFLSENHRAARETAVWLERFHLWWDRNPVFREQCPRGWALYDGDACQGFLGNFPTLIKFNGENRMVHNATSWNVLPKRRNQSMELLFRQMAIAKKSLLFNTTPTTDVELVLKAVGFHQIERPRRRSLFVLNGRPILKAQFSARRLLRNLAPLSSPLVIARQRLMSRLPRASDDVRQLYRADESFDVLWHSTHHQYDTTNVRTAAIINWYCFGSKYFEKILLGHMRNGNVLGYAILQLSRSAGVKRLSCADLWTDFADQEIVGTLISSICKYGRQNGVDLVIFPHFNRLLGDHLTDLGLLTTRSRTREYLKTPNTPAEPLDPDRTYFVTLQGDCGL